jgi:hypothetical protein
VRTCHARYMAIVVALGACANQLASSSSFERRLQEGASCSELFEIRNAQDPQSPQLERMNVALRGVGCYSANSVRETPQPAAAQSEPAVSQPQPIVPVQPDAGGFTVNQYRMYRTMIDTPMSVPEQQALNALARQHGISADSVRKVLRHVQTILTRNNWFGTPDSEIRHASDWSPGR